MTKYHLCEQTFSQFFPDDSPLVSFSSGAKGGGCGSPGQVIIKWPFKEVDELIGDVM